MNPWATNPSWQNFSSLVREATAAQEANTGMERSHHLTAALYFGIAALEAFLNEKMRTKLKGSKTEDEIFDVLRKGQIISKLKKWPLDLLGSSISLSDEALSLLIAFNDIRGDLTHPKTLGHDIYKRLESLDPKVIVEAVSEYIVKFHETAQTRYPYWIFGWNYINPRPDTHEIFIINDQQFSFSLQALGFKVPAAEHHAAEDWRNRYLKTYEGYSAIRNALHSVGRCEPKYVAFPYKPVLCRRWWTADHHKTCGRISEDALSKARNGVA